MRNAPRTAVLAAVLPAAVATVLAIPVTSGVTEALRTGHTATGAVVAWQARVSLTLTARLDLILRLVRCPTIENNT